MGVIPLLMVSEIMPLVFAMKSKLVGAHDTQSYWSVLGYVHLFVKTCRAAIYVVYSFDVYLTDRKSVV